MSVIQKISVFFAKKMTFSAVYKTENVNRYDEFISQNL